MKGTMTLALATLALVGCSQASTAQSAPAKLQPIKEKKMEQSAALTIEGKVVFQPMEGGFYGIIDDKGQKWLPLGLPAEMRRAGLRVKVEASKADVMTIQQWGTPIRINSITILDDKDVVGQGEQY
ncbi:hypothetical protein [Gallaecimonas xiamenensis]|uniref:Uncharacterized protein n=1 Tax=Gallaecimonas xiamenensis 3-C-1 TaxID=745411 RepID=K2JY27_9GAMM|nr:hypothetical protein [Gallaecimonas xiamenensis]EKE75174.1 hypothetical protein B3C1_07856 [Gallaecimonas xiamenensis 3-C-1]